MVEPIWTNILGDLARTCPGNGEVEMVEMERGPWKVPHTAILSREDFGQDRCSITLELIDSYFGENESGEEKLLSYLAHEYLVECQSDFSSGRIVEYRIGDIATEENSMRQLGNYWRLATCKKPDHAGAKNDVKLIPERLQLMSRADAEKNLASDIRRVFEAINDRKRHMDKYDPNRDFRP